MSGPFGVPGADPHREPTSSAVKRCLECTSCAATLPSAARTDACPCGICPLAVRYSSDVPETKPGPGIFRFGDRLPIHHSAGAISLGEGDTLLIEVRGEWTGRHARGTTALHHQYEATRTPHSVTLGQICASTEDNASQSAQRNDRTLSSQPHTASLLQRHHHVLHKRSVSEKVTAIGQRRR